MDKYLEKRNELMTQKESLENKRDTLDQEITAVECEQYEIEGKLSEINSKHDELTDILEILKTYKKKTRILKKFVMGVNLIFSLLTAISICFLWIVSGSLISNLLCSVVLILWCLGIGRETYKYYHKNLDKPKQIYETHNINDVNEELTRLKAEQIELQNQYNLLDSKKNNIEDYKTTVSNLIIGLEELIKQIMHKRSLEIERLIVAENLEEKLDINAEVELKLILEKKEGDK